MAESKAYKSFKRKHQPPTQTHAANATPRLGQTKLASPLRRYEAQRSKFIGESGYKGYRSSIRNHYRRSTGG